MSVFRIDDDPVQTKRHRDVGDRRGFERHPQSVDRLATSELFGESVSEPKFSRVYLRLGFLINQFTIS
jgi:hypothetical protein